MSILEFVGKAGVHEKEVLKRFGDRSFYRTSDHSHDRTLVILAFSNRSGSNLLAEYLRSTQLYCGFHEQLNYDSIIKTSDREKIDSFPDYISYLVGKCRPFQMFGIKASSDQLAMLIRLNIKSMFKRVKVIHIIRGDLIGQAISYSIADQTKRWTSKQGGISGAEPVFSYDDIKSSVEASIFSREVISILCQVFDIPYLQVMYEGVVTDPSVPLSRIGRFTGVDLSKGGTPKSEIEKQSSDVNDKYKKLFKEIFQSNVLELR